jgi:hypothetical protein
VYIADAVTSVSGCVDRDGIPKAQIANIGTPAAICISPGTHQYLFRRAGKLAKEFSIVNAIACRNENELGGQSTNDYRPTTND